VAQYFGAKLMMPAPAVSENIAEKTEGKGDDMMAAMRTQSLYFMPLMTVFIGWSFSMGLLLYWFVNSVFSVGQQLVIDGMKKD
jgi:membrane protein insertase Oxa1/YidC/SpoIIIJ